MLLTGMSGAGAARWWYLAVPPRSDYDEHAPFLRAYRILDDKPLSEWKLAGIFDSVFNCEARRNKLTLTEHRLYFDDLGEYLKAQKEATAPELLRYERYTTEAHRANHSAYAASRCVPTEDPELRPGR